MWSRRGKMEPNNKEQKNRYPVITLVLYFGDGLWYGPKSLKDWLTIPEKARRFVNDYKLPIIKQKQATPMCTGWRKPGVRQYQ